MPSFLEAGQGGHVADEPSVASYVRIRREFSVQALFSSVQYSFSNDGTNMVETLVLHVRDPKDLIQVSMEDSASSVTSRRRHAWLQYSGQPRPPGALRQVLGRAGPMLGSRRWSGAGPERLRTLFRGASDVLANYRRLLGVNMIVPDELAKITRRSRNQTNRRVLPKPRNEASGQARQADKQ